MQVTKFNLVTDLQIMLSNVTHSNFHFECNKERGPIDQLYIELGQICILNNVYAMACISMSFVIVCVLKKCNDDLKIKDDALRTIHKI